jgi:hypothetical protein
MRETNYFMGGIINILLSLFLFCSLFTMHVFLFPLFLLWEILGNSVRLFLNKII